MLGLLALFASEVLHSEDAAQYYNADQVGQDGRIDETEAAGQEQKALQYIRLAIELADHGRGDADHTDKRSDGGLCDGEECRIDTQDFRGKNEDIWDNEGRNAELRRIDTRLQGITAGDRRACKSSQRNWRGDIGDDAEVENEHMRS